MPRAFAVIGLTVFVTLAFLFDADEKLVLFFLILFTSALVISVIVKSIRRQGIISTVLASAALSCLLLILVNEFYYYPIIKLDNSQHRANILITGECEPNYSNYYYEAKVIELDGEKSNFKIRLVFNSEPKASAYDTINGDFKFYKLGATDTQRLSSHKSENRFLGAFAIDEEYNIVISNTENKNIGKYILHIRSYIKDNIFSLLPNDYGALAVAMILGDRTELSPGAYNSLRNCGVTHVICVSGLHLSLWASAVLWLLKKLKLGEKLACAIAIPAVLFLMLLTGMGYSVIRAGVMMLVYLLSVIISTRSDSLNSLGIALCVIALINPYSFGSLSLQLSALSTLGIILSSRHIMPKITEFFNSHQKISFLEKPLKLLTITAAATAFTLPVTIGVYQSFNLAVFPSNLIIVPLAEICMISSFFGGLIAPITNSIINIPALIGGMTAKVILKISHLISESFIREISINKFDSFLLLSIIFTFIVFCLILHYTGKKVLTFCISAVAILLLTLTPVFSYINSRGTNITAFDVGNGRSVLITRGEDEVLIGCGGTKFNGGYEIYGNAKEIDCLILPDNRQENSKYLDEIVKNCNIEKIYCDKTDYKTQLLTRFFETYPPNTNIDLKHIKIETHANNSGKISYLITTDDTTILVADYYKDLPENFLNARILICQDIYYRYYNFTSLKAVIIQSEGESEEKEGNLLSTAGSGAVTLRAEKGEITYERR